MQRPWFSDEQGSQTIEFLMVVPAVLMLLLCLGEFGKAAICKLTLQSAARDGAHAAALHALPAEVESVVRRAAGSVSITNVQVEQPSEQDVIVKVESLLELKVLKRLRLPEEVSHLRVQAESRVPLLPKHG